MRIESITGQILAVFNPWDISSVEKGERWIRDHGYRIWKCETSETGIYIVIVF